MKVSLNWLKELVNIETISTDNLAHKLTQAGFEVENIETINIDNKIDYILDITSTANRPDALSMIGLAREVSALTQSTIQNEIKNKKQEVQNEKNNIVDNNALLHCSYYVSAIIDNVILNDSPQWLKTRLQCSGFTSTNLIVDISNYIMLKWGQPINVHDFNKITNNSINNAIKLSTSFCSTKSKTVRCENRIFELTPSILVTQLNNSITSIAGIGINEELAVNQNTETVFIEVAVFKQSIVRRSSRAISIRTESSIRQERGINEDNSRNACNEALSLISELTKGNIRKIFSKEEDKSSLTNIDLSLKKVQDILGSITHNGVVRFLTLEEIERTLKSLNFEINYHAGNIINVSIPNYRKQDVFRDIDIIEEIARIYGYDHFVSSIPKTQFSRVSSQKRQFVNKNRRILRNLGLTELVHYSLVKSKGGVNVNNPLIQDYSALRCSLIEGLVEANAHNIKQSNQAIDGFEIGTVFKIIGNTICEATNLALILGGNLDIRSKWSEPAHSLNWYEAKGIVENFFNKLDRVIEWKKLKKQANPISMVQNNKAATLLYKGKSIGMFGELSQVICHNFGLNRKLFILEINLDALEDCQHELNYLSYQIKPYSKYPSITRDLSIVVPQSMEIEHLIKLLDQFQDNELESTILFDQYSSNSFGGSKKSIGLRFTYRSNVKTLTNVEVDNKQNHLQEKVINQLKLEIRH